MRASVHHIRQHLKNGQQCGKAQAAERKRRSLCPLPAALPWGQCRRPLSSRSAHLSAQAPSLHPRAPRLRSPRPPAGTESWRPSRHFLGNLGPHDPRPQSFSASPSPQEFHAKEPVPPPLPQCEVHFPRPERGAPSKLGHPS